MVAAGGFLRLNCSERAFEPARIGCGWPLIFYAPLWDFKYGIFPPTGVVLAPDWTYGWKFDARPFAVDAGTALIVILLLALVSESIIRRREARNP